MSVTIFESLTADPLWELEYKGNTKVLIRITILESLIADSLVELKYRKIQGFDERHDSGITHCRSSGSWNLIEYDGFYHPLWELEYCKTSWF